MVFSHGAFSEFAFSAAEFFEFDDSAFLGFLAEVDVDRCWLLEIDAFSLAESPAFSGAFSGAPIGVLPLSSSAGALTGGAVSLHYSTDGYISQILETVENLHAGTAQSGGVDTLELAAGASGADDHYNGMTLRLLSGAGSVQERGIVDYDGATKVATVFPAWRQNMLLWSNDPSNAAWAIKTGVSVSWDALEQAWAVETTIAADPQLGQNITLNPANRTFIFAIDVKGIGSTIGLQVQIFIYRNGPFGDVAATVANLTADWQRLEVTNIMDATAATTLVVRIDPPQTSSGGNVGDQILIRLAQLNENQATDYIETTTAAISAPDNTTSYEIPCDPIQVPAGDPDSTTWYEGALTSDISVERSIVGRNGIGGLSRVFAEARLTNPGGALDGLLRDYALDGRPARLYIGRRTDPRAAFGLVFSGVISSVFGDLNDIRLSLSDGISKLEQSIQATVYAGSGGLEGGADLAGKPKPIAYGEIFNVSPPLVDSTKLIYQAHDGPLSDVPAVYDRGVLLTKGADYGSQSDLETTAPAAGTYRVYKAGGYFRLGAAPDGTVTCDVLGDASGAGYIDRHADIMLRILVDRAALFSTELEPGSFSALNTAAAGSCGIWIGTEVRTVAEVIDELLLSAGAFGGFSRQGVFTVDQVATPGGIVAGVITEEEIGSLERSQLPPAVEPVIWRAALGYQKNYTAQRDLAASVPAARVAFAAEEQRVVSVSDSSIKSRRLLARDLGPEATLYVDQADADAEVQRRFDLWSVPRAAYRITTRPTSLPRELGDDVELTHSRFGLSSGALGRVIGHKVSALNTEVELTVLV
jgi:hypothetical protein